MFGLHNEFRGILGYPQRVGPDCAHRIAGQIAHAFGKPGQCFKRALLRFGIEKLVFGESFRKPDRLAQSVEHVKLIALDARDLQTETV